MLRMNDARKVRRNWGTVVGYLKRFYRFEWFKSKKSRK